MTEKTTQKQPEVVTVRTLVSGITIAGVGTVARGVTLKLTADRASELSKKKLVTIIH